MSLAALQEAFAAGVLRQHDAFLASIQPATAAHQLQPRQRLDIYANAYRARLAEAMADSYGQTVRYLGEDGFRDLALAYVEQQASAHYSLRWFGASLPAWLHDNYPDDREVAELAELDWALRAAFDCADAAPLSAADLAALAPQDWEHIGLLLHPGFQLLTQHFNTVAIWHALERGEAPAAAQSLVAPVDLLVWRREFQPHFRTLAADEAAALRELHAGASFASVCAALSPPADGAAPEDAAAAASRAGAWLRRWLDEGLLVGWR